MQTKPIKFIYIAHPIGGDVSGNLEAIKWIVHQLIWGHHRLNYTPIPVVPYYLTCQVLDDSISYDRELGMELNRAHFVTRKFDEIHLYGDRISAGMWQEIRWAEQYGIKVVPCSLATRVAFAQANGKQVLGPGEN